MVIIPQAEAVFIHIPRSGGTALSRSILNACEGAFIDLQFKRRHGTYPEALAKYPTYSFFTIMRNPWDLVRSYFGWCYIACTTMRKHLDYREIAFAEYLLAIGFRDAVPHILVSGLVREPGYWATYCGDQVKPFMYDGPFVAEISQLLGVTLTEVVVNESPVEPPQWDPRSIKLIGDYCRDDVDRFKFKPPNGG